MKSNSSTTTPATGMAVRPGSSEKRANRNARQAFDLLMTTTHPESAEQWAGEVVRVPAEFTERTVLIDLTEVTRIDSWGIALFIEALHRITAYGGHLVLIGLCDEVRLVFETAKLDRVFRICATREEALALDTPPHYVVPNEARGLLAPADAYA